MFGARTISYVLFGVTVTVSGNVLFDVVFVPDGDVLFGARTVSYVLFGVTVTVSGNVLFDVVFVPDGDVLFGARTICCLVCSDCDSIR